MGENVCSPVKIWPFELAPREYRVSIHGGDEDWVVEIPKGIDAPYVFDAIGPIEGDREFVEGFGWGRVLLEDDEKVVIIFAHA